MGAKERDYDGQEDSPTGYADVHKENGGGAAGQLVGNVELRGLADGVVCRAFDYVNRQDVGIVTGPTGTVDVQFQGALLLPAEPAEF